MVQSQNAPLPVLVIGSGPVGLAAAAHLAERQQTVLVAEAGGAIAHAVRQWGHVRLFSPWSYCIDPAAARLLAGTGWECPDAEALPTGGALVQRYLAPLAEALAAQPGVEIRTGLRIQAISRDGMDKLRTEGRADTPFVVQARRSDGQIEILQARAVIDASGTWHSPNPVGRNGLSVPGEAEALAAGQLRFDLPDVRAVDRAQYAGRRVLVVGSGHSAMNMVRDLADLGDPCTRIFWAMRRQPDGLTFGGGARDQLAARGRLGQDAKALIDSGTVTLLVPFGLDRIERQGDGSLTVRSGNRSITIDQIIGCTGFRPDLSLTREIRLGIDAWLETTPALAPMIDPNLHSCGTVRPHGATALAHPEPDFYTVGMKSYGRAPTFLMMTGYEQVRSVVAALTGDAAAAERVDLVLPETGVCRTDFTRASRPLTKPAAASAAATAGCCPA